MTPLREQYYPTYKCKNRDILLLEFEEAQKIANGQSNIYSHLTSILLGVLTILIPLFLDHIGENKFVNYIDKYSVELALLIFASGFLLLRHFVELQKTITINAKKVVTLRTMLGLDYGSIHLTLPNSRVEGASNPFTIRYFKGWLKFESTPFWILLIGVNLIWYLATKNKDIYIISTPFENDFSITIPWILGNIFISIIYLYFFRTYLNERHETNFLNIVDILASIFGLKLIRNFEYILYRAKLSYIELERLNIDCSFLKQILIDVEEQNFYKNKKGFSLKSLIRGMISQVPIFRTRYKYIKSGGSTITMQLVRTLFIPMNQNSFKRKLFEILFSIWLANQFSKDDILKLYIVSVRYERGIIGLPAAINHFFWHKINNLKLSEEESFFLVERLSNTSSTVNNERIDYLKRRVSVKLNNEKLNRLYETRVEIGLLSFKA